MSPSQLGPRLESECLCPRSLHIIYPHWPCCLCSQDGIDMPLMLSQQGFLLIRNKCVREIGRSLPEDLVNQQLCCLFRSQILLFDTKNRKGCRRGKEQERQAETGQDCESPLSRVCPLSERAGGDGYLACSVCTRGASTIQTQTVIFI